ncbi:MAG: hypothetical protein WBW04_21100 [Nitrolancea sp.]
MEKNQPSMPNLEQDPNLSVIAVSEHLREQVMEYVAELTTDDSGVTGSMTSSGLPLHSSGTRCCLFDSTDGGGSGLDINCPDHD